MKTKMMLMLCVPVIAWGMVAFVAAAASGGYVPTPAPVPMATFDKYVGDVIHGFFTIEDGSGPEGLRLVIEPNELTITSAIVEPIAGYPDARRYIYYFDHTVTASKTIIVKSYDSRNREVINSIVINLLDDDLHVFTGCGEITEPNEPISGIWWNNIQKDMRDKTRGNLVFHYNRVVEGKEGLSPKYESLDVLEDLIAKYDDPSYVAMNGWLVQ